MRKIKYTICLLSFLIIASININQLCNGKTTGTFLFSPEKAHANDTEGGMVTKYAYQTIVAGCRNADFSNNIKRCCKGSTTNCLHERCNGPVIQDCKDRGLLPVYAD